MHGRKRIDPNSVPEEEKQERLKKIAKYCKLSDAVLGMHQAHVLNVEALALTQKMLDINPEFYTLWNYRREIILLLLEKSELTHDSVAESELRLSQMALEKNPKSYCAWHHRRWVTLLGHVDLQSELATCTKFLNLDHRNFHCWDYRRFIVATAQTPAGEEFAYTTSKIEQNFSNFSSWHYRSRLMPQVFADSTAELLPKLDEEFQLIQQAFYTEPDDQSAWLYHRWLLQTSRKHLPTEAYVSTLKRELGMCDELLGVEPNCKQALLTVALMLQQLLQLAPSEFGSGEAAARVSEIFVRLRELDPLRVNYYNDVQQQGVMVA